MKTIIKLTLPVLIVLLSVGTDYGIADSGKQKPTEHPYYIYLLAVCLGMYLLLAIASVFSAKLKEGLVNHAPLLTGTLTFATLMAVEMNGNASGIGWYINWQKQVMMYDGVYAGLIIIAIMCSLILTFLFKIRDTVLVWQKGVIKW